MPTSPLSTRAGKPALYRVAASNLRFYLAACAAPRTRYGGAIAPRTGTVVVSPSGTTRAISADSVD